MQGWFIYSKSGNTQDRDTVVFMHENAGNIGLRMDWFELMYNRMNCNIVCFAYRGYSRSEGSP